MGVNRDAWQAVGPFDAATFGRGYGEETDWCLRAAAAGWRNVLAPNLFVYHADAGTFGSEEKRSILDTNLRVLHRRWPAYHRELAVFRRRDPWATRRSAAILALAIGAEADPILLFDSNSHLGAPQIRSADAVPANRGMLRVLRAADDDHHLVRADRAGLTTTLKILAGKHQDAVECTVANLKRLSKRRVKNQ